MIRPRVRRCICVSVAAASLGGGTVLTQAAGPMEFISRLWDREPQPVASAPAEDAAEADDQKWRPRLFKWFFPGGNDSRSGRIKVRDGGARVTSNRPELVSDPFLTASRVSSAGKDSSTGKDKSAEKERSAGKDNGRRHRADEIVMSPRRKAAPTPAPAQGQTQTQAQGHRVLPEARVDDDPKPRGTRRSYRVSASDVSNRGASSERSLDQHQDRDRSGHRTRRVANARQRTSTAQDSRFAPGFDAEFQKLVDEVLTESGPPIRHDRSAPSAPRLPNDLELAAADPSGSRVEQPPFDQRSGEQASPNERPGVEAPPFESTGENRFQPFRPQQPAEDASGARTASASATDQEKFARFAETVEQKPVEQLIEESRREMESTPLARQTQTPDVGSQQLSSTQAGERETQSGARESESGERGAQARETAVRPPFRQNQNRERATSASGNDGLMQQLSEEKGFSDPGLIVSSSDVPSRRLYTNSEAWLKRRRLDETSRVTAMSHAPSHAPVRAWNPREGVSNTAAGERRGADQRREADRRRWAEERRRQESDGRRPMHPEQDPPVSAVQIVPGKPGDGILIRDRNHGSQSGLDDNVASPPRPRVRSNRVPPRSVPDSTRFQRLGFDGPGQEELDSAVLALAERRLNGRETNQPGRGSGEPMGRQSASDSGRLNSTAPGGDSGSFAPDSAIPMLMLPDEGTGEDPADVATAHSNGTGDETATSPPSESPGAGIPWPDESEIAPQPAEGGFSWLLAAICLGLFGAAAAVIRRKSHVGTILPIGRGVKAENS